MADAEAGYQDLARASGLEISPEMLAVVMELLRLEVTPQGVVALLRSVKDAKLRAAAVEPAAACGRSTG